MPVDNILTDYYYYVIPRSKANYSAAWMIGGFTTTLYGARLGGIPNYDGDKRIGHAPPLFSNGTVSYKFNDHAVMSFDGR